MFSILLICLAFSASESSDIIPCSSDVFSRLSQLEASVSELLQPPSNFIGYHDKNIYTVNSLALEDPVLACTGDTVTLACNSTSVIQIETASYGSYYSNCEGCCDPQDPDCMQNMAQTNFQEWQVLNAACNGVQTCSYTFLQQNIPFCGVNVTADYLQMYFSCSEAVPPPIGGPTDFVGFTASSTVDQIGMTVLSFQEVLTNPGNHFDPATSVFTCPVTGHYYFFMNLQVFLDTDNGFYNCYVFMRKGTEDIALAENDDEFNTVVFEVMMTSSAVTECRAGENVYVEATYDECYVLATQSNFGGFLVAQFEEEL